MKENKTLQKIALGIDIRSGNSLNNIGEILLSIKEMGVSYEILFLESDTNVLIKRFKETRRAHPLANISGRWMRA